MTMSPASSARSARAAQAAEYAGKRAATSAGSIPDRSASRASRLSGRQVAAGPASRFSRSIRGCPPSPPVHGVKNAPNSGEALARREQVLARLRDARGHGLLCGLAVAPGIVRLLAADVAVHLEDAVVVDEHVTGDRPRERVLGVGVDVHLDHAVGDRLADLLQRGPRAAVEDQVERLVDAVLRADRLLDVLEHRRPQLHVPRLVDTVHVAERGGEYVAAALPEAEGLGHGEGVARRAVQLLVHLAGDAVLLAADDPDLHFHDDARLRALAEEI